MLALEPARVEVDMVPLIDIIVLLLMFLVVVGGIKKTSDGIQVNLPRADQAIKIRSEGQIIVTLRESEGSHYAVCGSARTFKLAHPGVGGLQSLADWLEKSAVYQNERGMCRVLDDGTYDIPVKLRIGDNTPMSAVEAAVDAVRNARLRDVHYAALPSDE